MGWKNTSARYGSLSIAMHWLMFLLIAAVYACIELRTQFARGSDIREALKVWHRTEARSVYLHYHFSVYGKFEEGKRRQLRAIGRLIGKP
jgi:cytochrome b561